jgi:lipopolysaccharide transport system ATP-binding protein
MSAIELSGISKRYKIYERPGDRLKELATFNRRSFHRDKWALRDVSADIRKGETFCIIGENGSGKSTLLEIISGILTPTEGKLTAGGRIAALLELGCGFNPEFTGRNNVFLNGAILGLSKRDVAARLDEILNFAEIGDFVDQPVKTYSSGMVLRLAFSVAVHLDPEILVVDEVLAVGDIYFRQRCMRKIHELRARGVTIILVSHEISDVKALGHRTLWLRDGRVAALGETDDVAQQYIAALVAKDSAYLERDQAPKEQRRKASFVPRDVVENLDPGAKRHGDGRASVLGIAILDERGQPAQSVATGSHIVVRITGRARADVSMPIFGIQLRTSEGVDLAGTNTTREGLQLQPFSSGDTATVDFHFQLPELAAGRYTFTPAVADGTLAGFHLCDMVEDAVKLTIEGSGKKVYGYLYIPCTAVEIAP